MATGIFVVYTDITLDNLVIKKVSEQFQLTEVELPRLPNQELHSFTKYPEIARRLAAFFMNPVERSKVLKILHSLNKLDGKTVSQTYAATDNRYQQLFQACERRIEANKFHDSRFNSASKHEARPAWDQIRTSNLFAQDSGIDDDYLGQELRLADKKDSYHGYYHASGGVNTSGSQPKNGSQQDNTSGQSQRADAAQNRTDSLGGKGIQDTISAFGNPSTPEKNGREGAKTFDGVTRMAPIDSSWSNQSLGKLDEEPIRGTDSTQLEVPVQTSDEGSSRLQKYSPKKWGCYDFFDPVDKQAVEDAERTFTLPIQDLPIELIEKDPFVQLLFALPASDPQPSLQKIDLVCSPTAWVKTKETLAVLAEHVKSHPLESDLACFIEDIKEYSIYRHRVEEILTQTRKIMKEKQMQWQKKYIYYPVYFSEQVSETFSRPYQRVVKIDHPQLQKWEANKDQFSVEDYFRVEQLVVFGVT